MLSPTAADLRIELRPDRARIHVALHGEIDLVTADHAATAVEGLLADGWRDLVLDLRGLEFMDSTGITLLVNLTRRAASEGWRFAVPPAPGPVDRLLELTGADELLVRRPALLVP